MDLGVRWKLHGDGHTPEPGAVVRPDERLSWPRTVGLGARHVVAMFGASFVPPVLMGLDPNLAIMMSGVATVIFLLATRGRVPSHLGCSLSFVGVAAVIRADGGSGAVVTGAVLVVGAVLYGMIGLLGAQIWINAEVDLRNPLNLVPAAAGVIIGVGNVTMEFTDTFELSGIALGTLVVITGYHTLRAFAPAHLKTQEPLLDEGTSSYDEESGTGEGTQRASS
ncbi:solute carrier family 23 protein [Streptomyces sp. bgisy027]|uniref:solute carrier family 23 protein n=1 Tax=Streptomyces sp. bgisy027 TaxID=3413770 RepID=UPI003D7227BF